MDNRRDFIRKAALLAGGTGLWSALPASVQRALAIDPKAGTTFFDAEHVVLLMQENRSFDHCFGMLQGVRGFNDPRALSLPNMNPVWLQYDKKGHTYAPFRLNMNDTKSTWMGDLPHSWENQVDARNNGRYDGWLDAKRSGNRAFKDIPLTLGYYTRKDIPFYYAMADAFTICDQHFCSALTGTTTNRLFFWSGTMKAGPGQRANIRNSDVYYNNEVNWKTFPERLEENNISWKVYQNELSVQTELTGEDEAFLGNFTDNNLEWFSKYQVRFSAGHFHFLSKRVEELPKEIENLENELKKLKSGQNQAVRNKLEQRTKQLIKYREELTQFNPENFSKLDPVEQQLHQRAFTTNVEDPDYHKTEELNYERNGVKRSLKVPKGDVLHQFRKDVDNGKLPTVSWLVAPQNFSDHPSAPWYGAWYVSEVMDILTKNPEVWKKTIFILTYDENDGYFDHIPPFVAPKPNDPESGAVSEGLETSDEYVTIEEEMKRKDMKKEHAREGPVGLGYRVPMIIASPWSRGGWVNSEVCDITSTLQFMEVFLEKKTGKKIKETNISTWRRAVCGNLTSVFRPFNGEKIAYPIQIQRDDFVKSIFELQFKELPSGYKMFTDQEIEEIRKNPAAMKLQQEKGTRRSCALPYELYSDGKITPDAAYFEISFAAGNKVFGNRSAGSAFNVYAPGKYLQQQNGAVKFEPVRTWAFAVKCGDAIDYKWPLNHFENGIYHLRTYGPNGFYREFRGDKNDPEILVNYSYEHKKNRLTGNIELLFKSRSKDQELILVIKDNAYRRSDIFETIMPGEQIVIAIDAIKNFGWYDLSLTIQGYPEYEQRLAGRVETGQHSQSDPYMGGV